MRFLQILSLIIINNLHTFTIPFLINIYYIIMNVDLTRESIPYGEEIDQKTFDTVINLINSSKFYPYILNLHDNQIQQVIENNEKKKTKKQTNNSDLLKEMLLRQLKNVPNDKKLQYQDMKRMCKYIKTSIFDSTSCSSWGGYITNANKSDKGTYINFYFRKRKAALHRLLYVNFIGELSDDEYLKFNCENKGLCCNIRHIKKFKYIKKDTTDEQTQKLSKLEKKRGPRVELCNDDLDVCFE